MMKIVVLLALAAVVAGTTSKQCHNLGELGSCQGPPRRVDIELGAANKECADGGVLENSGLPLTETPTVLDCQNACRDNDTCVFYVFQLTPSQDRVLNIGDCVMFNGVSPCCPNSIYVQEGEDGAFTGGNAARDLFDAQNPFNFTEGTGSIGFCTPGTLASSNFTCPDLSGSLSTGAAAGSVQTLPAGVVFADTLTIQNIPPSGCDVEDVTSPSINSALTCQTHCETLGSGVCGGWIWQGLQQYTGWDNIGATEHNKCYILPASWPHNHCPSVPPTIQFQHTGFNGLEGIRAIGAQNDRGQGGICFSTCGDGYVAFDEQCDGANLGEHTTCADVNTTLYANDTGLLTCNGFCQYNLFGCIINAAGPGQTLTIICTENRCVILVVLPVQPTADVFLTFHLVPPVGTINIPNGGSPMHFTPANWDIPQEVIVTLSNGQSLKQLIQQVVKLIATYQSADPNYNGFQTIWTLITSSQVTTTGGSERPYFGYEPDNEVNQQQIATVIVGDDGNAVPLRTETTDSFNGSGAAGIVYAALGSTFGVVLLAGIIFGLVLGRKKSTTP